MNVTNDKIEVGTVFTISVPGGVENSRLTPVSMVSTESLLKQYMVEVEPGQAETLLARLVFETAEPIVKRILFRRLGPGSSLQDREDLSGDVVVDMVARLQSAKRGEGKPIENFAGYIAVAAYHACDQYFRQRYPQRHRLKNRIRYLLEHTPRFSVWEDDQGDLVCGLASWKGDAALRVIPPDWEKNVSRAAGHAPLQTVEAIFARLGGPVSIETLVGGVAFLWGVKDQQVAWEDFEGQAASSDLDTGKKIDSRRTLERLWAEVIELPLTQRVALLLNLRDEGGSSALSTLPASGVATIRQIATALGLAAEELAALWKSLPLSDLDIAARLGLTRQQVINLRKSARQRLSRRLGNLLEQ